MRYEVVLQGQSHGVRMARTLKEAKGEARAWLASEPGADRVEVRRDGRTVAAWVRQETGWSSWRITRVTV